MEEGVSMQDGSDKKEVRGIHNHNIHDIIIEACTYINYEKSLSLLSIVTLSYM